MENVEKKFIQVGQLKVNGYVLIDEVPCQIKSIEKSKPGKHGTAKARITAIGVFNNQKKSLLKNTNADAEVPIIKKGTAQLVAVMGDTLQIIDTETYETKNVKKPKNIQINSGDEIEYQYYGELIKIVRKK